MQLVVEGNGGALYLESFQPGVYKIFSFIEPCGEHVKNSATTCKVLAGTSVLTLLTSRPPFTLYFLHTFYTYLPRQTARTVISELLI